MSTHLDELRALSRLLQEILGRLLAIEQLYDSSARGVELLKRVISDPSWAWLKPLPALIADIDHALVQHAHPIEPLEAAAIGGHVRALLFGTQLVPSEPDQSAFREHYRGLLQSDAPLAALHGQLALHLNRLPAEPDNESERLHARHVWAERRRHQREGKGQGARYSNGVN